MLESQLFISAIDGLWPSPLQRQGCWREHLAQDFEVPQVFAGSQEM